MTAPASETKRRTYPLKVMIWGEEGEILVSKGHHPPCPFLRRAIRAHRRDARDAPGWHGWDLDEMLLGLDHDHVRYEWWRHSPSRDMGRGTEWEGMRWFSVVSGPGPGAFPVTVVRLPV